MATKERPLKIGTIVEFQRRKRALQMQLGSGVWDHYTQRGKVAGSDVMPSGVRIYSINVAEAGMNRKLIRVRAGALTVVA